MTINAVAKARELDGKLQSHLEWPKCLNTTGPDDVNLTFAVLTLLYFQAPPLWLNIREGRASWWAGLYPALRTLYTPMHTPLIYTICMCGGGVRFIISKMCSYTTAEFK